jgi:hypothetical protein
LKNATRPDGWRMVMIQPLRERALLHPSTKIHNYAELAVNQEIPTFRLECLDYYLIERFLINGLHEQ